MGWVLISCTKAVCSRFASSPGRLLHPPQPLHPPYFPNTTPPILSTEGQCPKNTLKNKLIYSISEVWWHYYIWRNRYSIKNKIFKFTQLFFVNFNIFMHFKIHTHIYMYIKQDQICKIAKVSTAYGQKYTQQCIGYGSNLDFHFPTHTGFLEPI